jgi:hypothetical protein
MPIEGTSVTNISQPVRSYWRRDRNVWEGPEQLLEGAAVQNLHPITGIISQPEMARFAQLQMSRLIVPSPPQIHQGATIQETFPIPPVSQPAMDRYEFVRQSRRNNPDLSHVSASLYRQEPVLGSTLPWNQGEASWYLSGKEL